MFKVGTTVFDAKRRPAWTDRILFKLNKGNYDNLELSLLQTSYTSHPEFMDSDHKPVSSSFNLSVFSSKLAEQLLVPCFHPIVKFHTGNIYFNHKKINIPLYQLATQFHHFLCYYLLK